MTGFEFVWVLLGGGLAGTALGYWLAERRLQRELDETNDAELWAWINGKDR